MNILKSCNAIKYIIYATSNRSNVKDSLRVKHHEELLYNSHFCEHT